MKKILMIVAVASMTVLPSMAQKNIAGRQKLTPEQRVERRAEDLSRRMLLDDAAKAKFLPLYQEYMNELKNVVPAPETDKKPVSELTDKEIEARIEQGFDIRQKRLDLEKKYYKKFKGILNARQLQMVFGHSNRFVVPANFRPDMRVGRKGVTGPDARQMRPRREMRSPSTTVPGAGKEMQEPAKL